MTMCARTLVHAITVFALSAALSIACSEDSGSSDDGGPGDDGGGDTGDTDSLACGGDVQVTAPGEGQLPLE